MNIVVPLRFNKIWLRYIYIYARHEQELLYKHTFQSLHLWQTALTNHCLKLLRDSSGPRAWFRHWRGDYASIFDLPHHFQAPYGGHVGTTVVGMKKMTSWLVSLCFFPSYSSCLCLSNVLQLHNYEQYDTTPLTQQFLKLKNPMMNQTKKTQPLSSTVIKMCLSLHSSLITEHVTQKSQPMSVVANMLSSSLLLLKDQGP